MDPGSASRPRVPGRDGPSVRRGGEVRRRRPAGEPPPLPRRIGMTGWWWVGPGTLVIIGWTVAVINAGGALLPVDQRVVEELAQGRAPELTSVMVSVAELGSGWVFVALGWVTILVLLVTRRLRRLLVFVGATFLVYLLASYLADGILEQASPLRPAGIAMLGPAAQSAYPLVPVATRSSREAPRPPHTWGGQR
jgi:hypothetical protein